MGKHQLGLELSPEEAASIVTWLRSLSGALPPGLLVTDPVALEAAP